jgi:cytoskeletal protein RodZ
LFGNTALENARVIEAQLPRKNRGWLPLLTVLFLISYALMTMLIVEQGATIESQRALIRELFRDSTELTSMKIKAQQAAAAEQQAPSKKQGQNPSSQTQAPKKQTPSTQAVPQNRAHNQKSQPEFQPPSRPASDISDQRRALVTI